MGESPGKMYALAVVLTLLAVATTGLRFYARYLKKAGYSWDDYMILPALAFTIATAICMAIGSAIGDLGRHTATDSDGYPIVTHRTIVLLQIGYAVQLTQTLTFGLTKLSVLLFYRRIFQGPLINAAVWTNIGIVSVWSVAFFFSNLLQCSPISQNWATPGTALWNSCIDTSMMYIAQAYSDIFTDVLILALPIPCIWAMTIPARHKLAVSGIFLLGLLTVCAGIAKVVVFNRINYATNNGATDISYILTPSIYWPMIESSLGIVGACLPLLRPLFSSGSTSKGLGQVRDLKSVRLGSSGSHEGVVGSLKPWSEGGSSADVSVRRLVPSALEPWEGGEKGRGVQDV